VETIQWFTIFFSPRRVKATETWYNRHMATNANTIKVGDIVTLGAENGLGAGEYTVLAVSEADVIFPLYVKGKNGQTWPARREGARIVIGSPWPLTK